ncbi:MAG: tetratricopeptide repeat protein [Sandaracinus sp.]|nr:tetratricopeptide repeat protein [Sandaracinus sp.]
MLTPLFRWLLVALSIAFGVLRLMQGQPVGVLFLVGGAMLAVGHFLYGSVRAAFFSLRRGDLARAQKLIERSPPRFQTAETRAYRHWVLAALAEARGKLPDARDELSRALEHGPKSTNDRVLALGTLAAIHLKLGERADATRRLDEAEALQPEPRVRALLAKVRAKL